VKPWWRAQERTSALLAATGSCDPAFRFDLLALAFGVRAGSGLRAPVRLALLVAGSS
jgi:hypothetical protein